MSLRPPTAANHFYPGDKRDLRKMLELLFQRAGGIPQFMDGKPILGAIVPHAGYNFSGKIAARSFRQVAKGFLNIDSFIMLGPAHSGMGPAVAVSTWDFETPLGVVKNDTELAESITTGIIKHSDEAHFPEHSVEVQLPFLQHLSEISGKEFQIVPVCIKQQNAITAKSIGEILHEAIRKSGKQVCVIASSDFTHAGSAYHYLPCPKNEIIDWMYDHDTEALQMIKNLDLEGFFEVKLKNRLTICGSGPIGSLLAYARLSGVKEGKVQKYSTSYETSRNLRGVVGYASVIFE